MDLGSWILFFGFWIFDFGFWILYVVWILHIIATTRQLGPADKAIKLKQVGQALLTPTPPKMLRLPDVLNNDAADAQISELEVWPQSWVGG